MSILLEKGITLSPLEQGRGLSVPRPLPQPDEAAGADEDRQGARRDRLCSRASAAAVTAGTPRDLHGRMSPRRSASARRRSCAATRCSCASAMRDSGGGRAGPNVKILTSCPSLPDRPEPLPGRTCRAGCWRRTTSWSKWPGRYSARTGWPNTCKPPMPGELRGYWFEANLGEWWVARGGRIEQCTQSSCVWAASADKKLPTMRGAAAVRNAWWRANSES
jgi:hypothetical protein